MTRPEQALHRAAAQFLDLALPDSAAWFHIPNGGYRTATEAKIFQGLGVKPGVPDLAIIYRGRFIGIELKAGQGRLTARQKDMHECLQLAGAVVTTARSLNGIATFLGQLMPLKATLGRQQISGSGS